jgi:hypothetical protein
MRSPGSPSSTAPSCATRTSPIPARPAGVSSPVLKPKAKTLTIDVSSSAGSLSGTTLVGEAEAKKARAEKIGEAVAACYFIGPSAFDYSTEAIEEALRELLREGAITEHHVDRPANRLKLCIALARKLAAPDGSAATARAARGCGTKRIAIAPRVRRGKVVGVMLAKRQRPSGSSVRYSCTRSSCAPRPPPRAARHSASASRRNAASAPDAAGSGGAAEKGKGPPRGARRAYPSPA